MKWPIHSLGQILALEYGSALKESKRDQSGRIPVAGSNGVVGYHSTSLVNGPGVVVGRKGSAGEVTWSEGGFWPIDTTYYVRLLVPCHMRWAYYLLKSLRLRSFSIVTGVPGLNRNDAYRIQVSLPAPSEQRRIVEILDQADALRKKRAEADAKAGRILSALFYKMFGDPLINSMGWPIKHVKDLAEVQGGLQLSPARDPLPLKLPYLRVANVYRDRLDLNEVKAIGLTPEEMDRTVLTQGDVLIVEGHGNPQEIGRSAVWDGTINPCVHQNHLIRVRPDTTMVLPLYLSNFLNSDGGRLQLIRAGKTTSGLNTISVRNVKAVKVPIPPLDIQEQYYRRALMLGGSINQNKFSKNHLDRLFENLLVRAFAGDLTAKWREAHTKELLVEMEHQTQALSEAC